MTTTEADSSPTSLPAQKSLSLSATIRRLLFGGLGRTGLILRLVKGRYFPNNRLRPLGYRLHRPHRSVGSLQTPMALHSVWIIPFLTCAISLLAFLVSYCIAVYNGHVNAFWPYISDSGSMSPESCVFGQLLNIASIFLAMTVYLRHRQIVEYYWHHLGQRGSWRLYSNVSLWIGFVSALGCSIVANFQQINVILVHYIGAFLAFAFGLIYLWMQTAFSYKMRPALTSHWLCHFRLFLGLLSTAAYFNTIVFALLAGKGKTQWNPHCEGSLYNWDRADPKYIHHTIATVSEWSVAACFQLYILSFVVELRNACCYAPKLKLNTEEISRDEPTETSSGSTSEEREMPSSETVAKIKKYMDQLNREDKIRHALSRLEKIDMTLDLLQKTQVGKAVNQLCRHSIYGKDASRIVARWKEIARRNGIMPVKQEDPTSSEDEQKPESDQDASPKTSKRYTPSPEVYGRKVPKKEVEDDSYSSLPCSSSTSNYNALSSYKEQKPLGNFKIVKKEEDSFSRMLAMVDTQPKAKKPKIMDFNEIDLNYRPLPSLATKTQVAKPAEEQFNPEQMFKPRNDRLKVFAGRRKGSGLTQVPRLFDSCMRVLSNNIGSGVLDDVGSIPFFILEPVLEKCTWKQLERIENRNHHLEEDSDQLWEKFFIKHHVGKKKNKKESFKDAFFRLNEENDAKFRALSDRIKKVNKSEEMQCHRTEIIDEAYAPLNVRRKQARHGTAYGNRALPTASEISKARKEIFDRGSSKSLAAIPSAVINRFSTVGSKKDSTARPQPPKKGALMVKTLKMLHMKRR